MTDPGPTGRALRYGIWVPNFGDYGDARRLGELARAAEEAGWDGFFLWDHVFRAHGLEPGMPVVDPWIALSVIAVQTTRLRLGTMITPVPRRRPWKLAREVASLDQLSGGRVVLGVGSGSPAEFELGSFGEDTDPRTRARRLDEGLEILCGLWSGETFDYRGIHHSVQDVTFQPRPVQSPRVPIWVAAAWPSRRPFERAARWDGVFPLSGGRGPSPSEVREISTLVRSQRRIPGHFDLVASGATSGRDDREALVRIGELEAAGATWWLERLHPDRAPLDALRRRIVQGPPRGQTD